MLDKKTDPNYRPIQLTTGQLAAKYRARDLRIEKEERLSKFNSMTTNGTQAVMITNCTVAGIKKQCYMTGEFHTNPNGTRFQLITYNSVRDKVQILWLSSWCFEVIDGL